METLGRYAQTGGNRGPEFPGIRTIADATQRHILPLVEQGVPAVTIPENRKAAAANFTGEYVKEGGRLILPEASRRIFCAADPVLSVRPVCPICQHCVCGVLLSMIPFWCCIFSCKKYIVSGVTTGAVKG